MFSMELMTASPEFSFRIKTTTDWLTQKNDQMFMRIDHAAWARAAVGRPVLHTSYLVQDQSLGSIWFYLCVW